MNKTKIIWPSVKEMQEMMDSGMSNVKIGKKLGVSDNAVKKFCKKNGIYKPKQMPSTKENCSNCKKEFHCEHNRKARGIFGLYCSTDCRMLAQKKRGKLYKKTQIDFDNLIESGISIRGIARLWECSHTSLLEKFKTPSKS